MSKTLKKETSNKYNSFHVVSNIQIKKEIIIIKTDTEKVQEKDKILNKYLKCLNKKRCYEYDSWFRIGAIIFNENGSYMLFDEWSKNYKEKYSSKECEKVWKTLKNGNGKKKITIKSLIKWAREDNPKQFMKIKGSKDYLINLYVKSIFEKGITDRKIAKLYSIACKDKFLWDEINGHWYIINEYNIWKKDTKGNKIMNDMSESLQPLLFQKYSNYLKNLDKSKDNKFEKELIQKNYSSADKYLETYQRKKSALTELIGICDYNGIFEKMDNIDLYLFAFDNGVYDLEENKFRLPKPKELITCTCNYKYQEINEKIKDAMQEIYDIFDSIFLYKEDAETILIEIAQCLNGIPALEEFYVWKGKGRNGKGVIRDLILYTFGNYYDPISIDYFNQTKHGKAANASDEIMARKKNCRIVISTEPESNMTIKFNTLKSFSGRDDIQCRHNFGKCFNFKPKFRLIFQTNYDFEIDSVAGQEKINRIRIREFPFVFVDKPIMKFHKSIDKNIKEKISEPEYRIAFFHILLKYYNIWINNNKVINYSKNFADQTNEYLINNDPFSAFYDKFVNDGIIIPSNNYNDRIEIINLFKIYKKYYAGENKNMTNKDFRLAVENKGFKVVTIKGRTNIRNIKLDETKVQEFMNLNRTNADELEFIN